MPQARSWVLRKIRELITEFPLARRAHHLLRELLQHGAASFRTPLCVPPAEDILLPCRCHMWVVDDICEHRGCGKPQVRFLGGEERVVVYLAPLA